MDRRLRMRLRARRRKRVDSEFDPPKDPNAVERGWYVCCDVRYYGFAWRRNPPCPDCGAATRKATAGEVWSSAMGC